MSRDSMPSTAPKNPEVYRILRLLGEGGMGARRKIALKVIKAVWASKELLRCFGLETQTPGRLHHPGIAQIILTRIRHTDVRQMRSRRAISALLKCGGIKGESKDAIDQQLAGASRNEAVNA